MDDFKLSDNGILGVVDKKEFRLELQKLINRYNIENGSNTPDFLLCKYLMDCLDVYEKNVTLRDSWYGKTK